MKRGGLSLRSRPPLFRILPTHDRLVVEWVAYVQHLQGSYPFLFSLVTRTHPFVKEPSPVITE